MSANPATDTVRVLLGKGNGKFQPAQDFAAGSSPPTLAAADFDDNGWGALAVGTSDGLAVLLNDGTW